MARGLNKDIQVLVDKARAAGWGFTQQPGRHPMLFPTNENRPPIAVPISPKGRRGIANFRSELRKAGLEL